VGASLHLLTVVPTRGHLTGPQGLTGNLLPLSTSAKLDLLEAGARDYLAKVVAGLQEEGAQASAHVLRGDPLKQIQRYCAEQRIDTIALGTHGRAGTEAFWNASMAQRLMRSCDVSLLLVPVD
jgi:nucleotide-binding universal stress UspA family protein